MSIKKLLPGVKENILLKNYTTFRIGGPAKYFFVAGSKEDLILAIQVARKLKLPFFILGGGSNTLVSDKGYKGLVINFQFSIFNFQNNKIYAGAGTQLGKLVNFSVEKGLAGLEWAAGIPGTVGGAIRGNSGAFGSSMADVVKSVEVFDAKSGKIKNIKNCHFGYKDNIFKRNPNLQILSAEIRLKKGNKSEIKNKIKEHLDYRVKHHPLNFPSAGCIFKNPKIKIKDKNLLEKFPEIKEFNKRTEIPAGWLIEKSFLKGKRIGDAQFSEKHANFIINLGNAKAKDVKKLINLAKKEVKKKFGITLEEEIQFLEL